MLGRNEYRLADRHQLFLIAQHQVPMPRVVEAMRVIQEGEKDLQKEKPTLLKVVTLKHYSSASFDNHYRAGMQFLTFFSVSWFFSRSPGAVADSSPVHNAYLVHASVLLNDFGDIRITHLVASHELFGSAGNVVHDAANYHFGCIQVYPKNFSCSTFFQSSDRNVTLFQHLHGWVSLLLWE